ncbi:GAF domain-containing protein [Shigella flexneri]
MLGCDASALLRYEGRQFIPLAIDGLAKDVLGGRFTLEGHPRLETIARAGDVVRSRRTAICRPVRRADSQEESLKVHACIGLPLFAGQNLIGALTLDGMSPGSVRYLQRRSATADCCAGGRGAEQRPADRTAGEPEYPSG